MIRPTFLDSTSVLVPCGVETHCLDMEDALRRTTEHVLVALLDSQMEEVMARVVLLSEATTDVHARVYCQSQSPPSASAAEVAASQIAVRTGYRSKVRVELSPCQSFSTLQPGDPLPGRTPWR